MKIPNVYSLFNISNMYLLLWCLYYIQGTIYPMGSVIPRICLVLVLLITLYFWVQSFQKYRIPTPLRVLNILILILFVYALFYQMYGNFAFRSFDGFKYTAADNIRTLIASMLPVYPIYLFTIKGYLNKKNIRIWFFVFLVVATFQFFAYESARLEMSIYDTDGLTNNISYYFLALLPLVFLYRKSKILMYVCILYIMCFLIYGMKRGAILIGFCVILYIIYKDFKNSSVRKKVLISILVTLVSVFVVKYIMDLAASSNYFQYRLEQTLEGESSGRDSYYHFFFEHFFNENDIIKFLFGGGAYYTVKLNGNLAHNDWLELLTNQGLLGVSLLFAYWMTWSRYILRTRNSQYFPVLFSSFLIFFVKSLMSMSIMDTLIYGMLPIGYCLGCIYNKEQL